MKPFDYYDVKIGVREMAIVISSVLLGVGVMTMPRMVALTTRSSDGWLSILLAGVLTIFFAWITSKLSARFPGRPLHEYAPEIITKPLATVMILFFLLYFIGFGAYETRMIANISKQYLFERTPTEVIAFAFLMVVFYTISGTRIALLRLNVLFLPFVLFMALFVLLFSLDLFDKNNLDPQLVTPPADILKGSGEALSSFLGIELVLFYACLMRQPNRTSIAAAIGVSIPLLFYLAVYIVVIGVFTSDGTANIQYPTVELAKEIEIPGEFFERFESVFFTVWIMTVFNTTSLLLDVALICLRSTFHSITKPAAVCIVVPIVFFLAMLPQDFGEVNLVGTWIGYLGFALNVIVPLTLLLISKARGIRGGA